MAHHQNPNQDREIPLEAAQEGNGLLHTIENNKYHGLATEDPFDHLDKFDSYCGLSKTNGVSEDALKLRLFPFSLGDKARQWEKSLPSDSITTWDECKEVFLDKFFSISRTAKIRNEISGFQQRNLESFSEAWERFKGYQAHCPHHGFSKESLLSTFYRGAIPQCRNRLDTASNGFFLGRNEVDAEELIENMAKSDSVYSEDHDRVNRSDDQQTKKELKSLEEKLDLLLANKAKLDQMKLVGEQQQKQVAEIKKIDGLEGHEEVCFINNNGTWYRKEPNFQYQNNYQQKPLYNNQQGGYQTNQPTQARGSSSQAQVPSSTTESMFKQILEAQGKFAKDIRDEFKAVHAKIDGTYSDLNNKYMQLASHVKALESQVASLPSTSKQPMGTLPGKAEANPREHCNVLLSSDTSHVANYKREVDEIERLVFGTEIEQVEHVVVATAESKIVQEADRIVAAKVEQSREHKAEKPVERRSDQRLNVVKQEDTEVELSPYDKLPFPERFLTKAQKKVVSKFRKDLSDIGVRLPEIHNMQAAHVQMMLIKDILDHQAEVAELLDISTLKLDPPIPPKSLPKLGHQGMFTLPCSLGKLNFDDALVDSGASVNVISLEVMKSLGIERMLQDTSTLQFGDSSSTTPIGIIKDFLLQLGACTIPIDLTVLEMATGKIVPLILGTPFLTTVGACIDFANNKVTLLNVNKAVSYPLQSPKLKPEYCGTITCGASSIEKTKAELSGIEKEVLGEESPKEKCDEHLESAQKEEVSEATKASHGKKKIVKESHPPPLEKTPHTLTLHPMKLKDGAIEYKIKCKGRSKPFSSARAIITPQFQDDPLKLQELLSQVLTITLEGGKVPPSH
ncbi:uncharacterized protein LOC130506482 [Raphanus sativus]|uniref:Uncharacterized protein LOC130506482 n=1 Tax=Raphanus sativus TaxID=3726 RepID=A0A9W3D068_RAPSA|nr:uncharacterized protein LOC130506482 [Raphanus sativus]